jgi:ABC-type Fe3+/spermidine/putrescine transport system ATPase subunit
MRAEIRRIQKATNITTIFVTHDQEEAMAVGDRLAVLRKGVVEQIGTSDELYNKPRNAFVANFIGKMNFFNAHVIESGPKETIAEIDTTGIRVAIKDERRHVEPKAGDEVLIGGRPEYLAVCAEPTDKSVPGVVRIIQHLGSFIRYEVEIDRNISPVTLEIDMDSLQKDIHEGDTVNVTFDGSRVALFSPEGREL